jgi:hypothetical protein
MTTPAQADPFCQSGSAYLFDVATGSQIAKLTASDAAADNLFGSSVALSGSTAIVGTWTMEHAIEDPGSAYLFDFSDPCNITEIKLTASDAADGDLFGYSVATSWARGMMTTPAASPARPTCSISAIPATLSKPS